ncbi:MAG: dipeptide/tripeptide permease [Thiotrichales bacterium]|nr:MAG: dipeptide/tripeptide permease [Thiotrichales bacterium]
MIAKQPRAFYLIFSIEFWERFGFYGMQALIVLFMVNKLGYSDENADLLFGGFMALLSLLPCLGGYIGDNILGTKRTIILGALVLAVGYLLLSVPYIEYHYLLLPLATIAVGNGLFKANPASLLSSIYKDSEVSLDSGYTLYYMAINIGGLTAMLLTPVIRVYFGWYLAFLICCIGLVIVIVNFIFMSRVVKHVGSKPDFAPIRLDYLFLVLLMSVGIIGCFYWLLQHEVILSVVLILGSTLLFAYFIWQIVKAPAAEKKNMVFFLVLTLQAIIFFVLYSQMPTSMTLFAERNVQHSLLGIHIEPASYQALNEFWIVILAPILAIVYQQLRSRNIVLSMATKFALGTLLAASAFLSLSASALFAHNGVVSGWWLVLAYFLESAGELLVSALGLSLVAQYIPRRLMGFTMGFWYLCTAIAFIIGGHVAAVARIPESIAHDAIKSLPLYSHLFLQIGVVTTMISILMFAFIPLLRKLGRKPFVK